MANVINLFSGQRAICATILAHFPQKRQLIGDTSRELIDDDDGRGLSVNTLIKHRKRCIDAAESSFNLPDLMDTIDPEARAKR